MTKTWSVEVIMWQLAGQKGEDKLDPGARDSTIKRMAAFYSTPTVIEDNASSNKVFKTNQNIAPSDQLYVVRRRLWSPLVLTPASTLPRRRFLKCDPSSSSQPILGYAERG